MQVAVSNATASMAPRASQDSYSQRWRHVDSRSALLLIIAAAFACNDATSPTTGKAEITVTVSGLDVDPDGYQVMVDGNPATTIAGPKSVTLDLSLGQHAITLAGLASNCTLQSPVVQEITVSPLDTAKTSFAVVCTALTGVVQVTA